MVHLPTLHAQNTYYERNKGIILDPHHRYAVISNNNHTLFKTADELYAKHPYFKQDATPIFGTLPKLVDIAKELNLPIYQQEVLLQEQDKWNDDFVTLMEHHEKLAQRQSVLEAIIIKQ